MFDAYVDFMEQWYDIGCESTYESIVMDFFSLASQCEEPLADFILNTAMAEKETQCSEKRLSV